MTWKLAALVAIVGELILGFSSCGGAMYIGTTISMVVLLALVISIVACWKSIGDLGNERRTVLNKLIWIIGFILALLLVCSVANALGWVAYYSPETFSDAIREFSHGLYGEMC